MNKEEMLMWVHLFNAATMITILRMVQKIIECNQDKIKEINQNTVELKDFTVVLHGVPIDKYSQDTRVLKMKIWLQLHNLIKDLPGE